MRQNLDPKLSLRLQELGVEELWGPASTSGSDQRWEWGDIEKVVEENASQISAFSAWGREKYLLFFLVQERRVTGLCPGLHEAVGQAGRATMNKCQDGRHKCLAWLDLEKWK